MKDSLAVLLTILAVSTIFATRCEADGDLVNPADFNGTAVPASTNGAVDQYGVPGGLRGPVGAPNATPAAPSYIQGPSTTQYKKNKKLSIVGTPVGMTDKAAKTGAGMTDRAAKTGVGMTDRAVKGTGKAVKTTVALPGKAVKEVLKMMF